jgi:outer membrane protein OmpA-like peptidoglycan-associated protein
MKKLTLAIIAIIAINAANAQFIKRMADRAKNRLEQKAGQKVDKGVDEATEIKKKDKKKESEDSSKNEEETASSDNDASSSSSSTSSSSSAASSEENPTLKTYSKYDFIPGDKVIAFEDFAGTDIGDFPVRWNTNATAEVVNLNNKEGKWLKLTKQGAFHPEFITELPENFTLEFDLGVNDNWNSYPLAINITKFKSPEDFKNFGYSASYTGEHVVHLNFKPSVISSRAEGGSMIQTGKSGDGIYNNVGFTNWDNTKNKFAHISIWRQKQRLRVYLNGQKIWDIPKAFDATAPYNAVTFGMRDVYQDDDFMLLNNIRLAVGAPDTRNKLITEGKFVTRGILFDVNSDVVKAESYGTIKDIANVLKENANVRVKVIGHTDSDGDDKANLDLSKRRSESVKNALVSEFGIDGSRIETDGKGESQPVDKSETSVGKANNRRVEFIKL